MKINAVPAVVIGSGLALTLYTSGGTNHPVNYVILIVSILCMSMFFSVHYLTIYYLLQPYNAGTEIKSGTYRIVMTATYADSDFWYSDDGVLCSIWYCGEYSGFPFCTENLQNSQLVEIIPQKQLVITSAFCGIICFWGNYYKICEKCTKYNADIRI